MNKRCRYCSHPFLSVGEQRYDTDTCMACTRILIVHREAVEKALENRKLTAGTSIVTYLNIKL